MNKQIKHFSWKNIVDRQQIAHLLQQGKIGVMPTDTIYGLLGSAEQPRAVSKIYRVRRRPHNKPMIILINSWQQIKDLGVTITPAQKRLMVQHWPGAISFIVPCPVPSRKYLHRGQKTISLRWPANLLLQRILRITGPLVAPSANLAGLLPALDIKQAERYFGRQIDFYCSRGVIQHKISTVVDLTVKPYKIIRPGVVKKL